MERFLCYVMNEAGKLGYNKFSPKEDLATQCARVHATGSGKPSMLVVASLEEIRLNDTDELTAALAAHRVNNAYRTANIMGGMKERT